MAASRIVYSEAEVVDMVIGIVESAGSYRQAAEAFGVSHQYLFKVAAGEKRPSPAIYMALGLDRHRYTEFPEYR